MAPTVGYWKIRGRGQAIRLALSYKEVEFEDKRYEQGPAPEYSREDWLSVKFTLGLDLPNLPYFIDGEYKITETSAVLDYIGRKWDLNGSTELAKIRNQMSQSVIKDIKQSFTTVCYSPDFEQMKPKLLESFPAKLKTLSDWLGDNEFYAGSEVTMCDFMIYDSLDIFQMFSETCLDDFPKLKEYIQRVEALPTIKAYMESSDYMRKPINNKSSKWGGEA